MAPLSSLSPFYPQTPSPFMSSYTFPFGAILFDFFFLLIAIALESLVFQNRLKLNAKASVVYAATLNLFASVASWFIFFSIEPMLPVPIRAELISYIVFNQFNSSIQNIEFFLLPLSIVIFFLTFLFKIVTMQLLDFLLQNVTKPKTEEKLLPRKQRRSADRAYIGDIQSRGKATAVLLATASSYSAILLVIFIRSIAQKSFLVG